MGSSLVLLVNMCVVSVECLRKIYRKEFVLRLQFGLLVVLRSVKIFQIFRLIMFSLRLLVFQLLCVLRKHYIIL